MDNERLARMLYEMGALIERSDLERRRFRAAAYRRAAESIAGLTTHLGELSADELAALPAVGSRVAARIVEALDSGTIQRLEGLRRRDPAGAEALLRVPGLGPRTVARLRDTLGIRDLDGLRAALESGRVSEVRGMGPAAQARLRDALTDLDLDREDPLVPLADVVPVAGRLAAALARLHGVGDVQWAGPMRRFHPLVDAIDLFVAASEPSNVPQRIGGLPMLAGVTVSKGTHDVLVSGSTHDGPAVRIHVGHPAVAGAALLHATGDDAYIRALASRADQRGMVLGSAGLTDGRARVATGEDAIHAALGLQPVPPERRDGATAIDLAAAGRLPATADVADLRGDLHDHTDWSGDGRMTLESLVDAASSRGWSYLAITDHAEDLRMNGLDRGAMLAQRDVLRALRPRHPDIALLHGAELNIDADGALDYDAAFLAGFDWTVASVHSAFGMDVEAQTRRLVTAIRHPAVRAIGHLSGRRIGRRPGIRFDVDAVLDACHDTGTALEVNCHLDRLDTTAEVLAEAAQRGVLTVISTDAHRLGDLDQHRWGIAQARRGGVPRDLVANTWPVERFLEWAGARL